MLRMPAMICRLPMKVALAGQEGYSGSWAVVMDTFREGRERVDPCRGRSREGSLNFPERGSVEVVPKSLSQ